MGQGACDTDKKERKEGRKEGRPMSLKDEMTPQEIRALMRLKTQKAIEAHGCLVMGVFPTETSELPVSFAYSIGLPITFPGAAEVLIIGLDSDSSHRMINTIMALMKEGQRFADGDEASGIIQRLPLAFRTVPKRHYHDFVGRAIEYHGGSNWPLLQLIWPDTHGRFPWQAGFEERFRAMQPLLCDLES
jgi:hypothetical protein